MASDRVEKLDYPELWFQDGLAVVGSPGGFLSVEVDMSQAGALRDRMKAEGQAVTYTHLLIRAAAAALVKLSDLHRLIAGGRRMFPGSVDLCVSVAGDAALTPVVILKDAGRKTLDEISREVRQGGVQARIEHEKLAFFLGRWGWIVPLSGLRRGLLRSLLNRLWYRRRASGTFQLTVVPTVDVFVPFLFNTAGVLAAGRVRDRVVAVDGRPEVRPILVLACCFDHKVWNGMDAARFLNAVKENLETCE